VLEAEATLVLPATKKCIVIGGHKFCKDFGKEDNDKGTKAPPAGDKSATPAEPKCTKPNMIEVKPGVCACKPGYDYGGGEGCEKKCAYGMVGTPPNCKCPTGATLEVTGKFTKGCICPDGRKPADVGDNYVCQYLGPQ
jgi:hypothetical protein